MKLEGLRVVDLTLFLPGPYLTLALADHGAEVIKIEPPEGDPTRRIGPADGPTTVYFRSLNRGKKSVVLDLKGARNVESLLALAATADVFVESFRPGVCERLGVGYTQVSQRNPRIVYCSVNAFGNSGPYRDRPAHDLSVEALTGVLGMTLGDDGRPALPGVPMADIAAGLQGLAGILMALLERERTGRGDYVEIAMFDSLFAALPNVVGPVLAEQRDPDPKAQRTTGGAAFYRLYDTRDGRQIALAGQEPKFIERVLTALGRTDLIELCARGPGPHQRPVVAALQAFFASRSRQESLDWLAGLDVCYAPVNTLLEATLDPQVAARELLLADERGRRHLAPPIRFAAGPARPSLREPALGEHTNEILAAIDGAKERQPSSRARVSNASSPETTAYSFTAIDIDGRERRLSEFAGRALLIVNVASKCGFTPQYRGLEALWRKRRAEGLTVLGFPCDQFGHQEPGGEAEIKQFCSLNYDVTFPLFAKIDVNGANAHPLYRWLKGEKAGVLGTEAIKWNFTKFLVDRSGRVVRRFAPADAPEKIDKLVGEVLAGAAPP